MSNSIRATYNRYLNTDQGIDAFNAFKRILYTDADSLCQILVNDYISVLPLKQRLNVCDIGGGDGLRTHLICKGIKSHGSVQFLEVDIIEQSPLMITRMKNVSQSYSAMDILHVIGGRLEECTLPREYDLALFVHSIYALDGFEAFEKVYSALRPGGTAIVVTNGSDSFLGTVKRELDVGWSDQRYEINRFISDISKASLDYVQSEFTTKWSLSDADFPGMNCILEWLTLGKFSSLDDRRQTHLRNFAFSLGAKEMGGFRFSESEIVTTVRKPQVAPKKVGLPEELR